MKILIGDIVQITRNRYETITDYNLEQCTVLDLDNTKNEPTIKVAANVTNKQSEFFFDWYNNCEWFSTKNVVNIERDYKVINITDNHDTVTRQPVTIVTMAKVIKKIDQSIRGSKLKKQVNTQDTDLFVYFGVSPDSLYPYLNTINRINFAMYKPQNVMIDGVSKKVWFANPNLVQHDNIFSIYNVA